MSDAICGNAQQPQAMDPIATVMTIELRHIERLRQQHDGGGVLCREPRSGGQPFPLVARERDDGVRIRHGNPDYKSGPGAPHTPEQQANNDKAEAQTTATHDGWYRRAIPHSRH